MKITIEWTKKEETAAIDLANQVTEIDQDTIKNIGKKVKEEIGDMIISEKESGKASLYISDRITTEFIDMLSPVVHMTKAIFKAIEKAAERVGAMIENLDKRVTTEEGVTVNGHPDTPFHYMHEKVKNHYRRSFEVSASDIETDENCGGIYSFTVRNFNNSRRFASVYQMMLNGVYNNKVVIQDVHLIGNGIEPKDTVFDDTDIDGIIAVIDAIVNCSSKSENE